MSSYDLFKMTVLYSVAITAGTCIMLWVRVRVDELSVATDESVFLPFKVVTLLILYMNSFLQWGTEFFAWEYNYPGYFVYSPLSVLCALHYLLLTSSTSPICRICTYNRIAIAIVNW